MKHETISMNFVYFVTLKSIPLSCILNGPVHDFVIYYLVTGKIVVY